MKIFGFDFETTGLDPHKGAVPFLIACWFKEHVFATKRIEDTRKWLEDKNIIKLAHNMKFDMKMARAAGIEVKGEIYDTMLMAHLFDENLKSKSLDFLTNQFIPEFQKLGGSVKDWFEKNDIAKEDQNYADVPDEIMVPYAKMDIRLTKLLFDFFEPKLKEMGLWDLFLNECRLTKVLVDMEWRGVAIDVKYFEKLGRKLEKEIETIANEVFAITGKKFDIASNPQLGDILLELGEKVEFTDKGNYSTDKDALGHINHPLAVKVLEFRNKTKLYSTYVAGMLKAHVDGVIRCDLYQIGARTGRFSAFEPNLQNVPKDDKLIRSGFINRKGFTNFYFDYDQMEIAVFVDYAKDKRLLAQLEAGVDYHQFIADDLGIKRSQAKTLNFGLLYGMGVPKLMVKLDIEVTEEDLADRTMAREAKGYHSWYVTRFNKEPFALTPENCVRFCKAREIKKKYFARFTTVEDFIKKATNTSNSRGYVFNKFGRRRRLGRTEGYKAPNALVQGTCADIVKFSMVRVHELLLEYKSNLILMVHDEIVVEIADGEEFLVPMVKELMEDWSSVIKAPLKVGIEYTKTTWADKEDWHG